MKYVLVTIGLSVAAANAQPVPKLNSISQEYIQRGGSFEVTLEGENIGGGKVIVSGDPGVKVSLTPPPAANIAIESNLGGVTTVAKTDAKKIIATVDIDEKAMIGVRELRVASPGGVSNPINLIVSHLPEVKEGATITLPVAITGNLGAVGEVDSYKFTAKKSQRVVIEAVAQRIGSAMDTSLAVFDGKGKELARSEDAIGNDSVLEFKAPEDGEYTAQIRDYRMQGGNNFRYRLQMTTAPYVMRHFPFGGRRGEAVEVELSGYNLRGAEKMTLQLAKDAPGGQQELRTVSPLGLSNPFPFMVGDLPQVMESEPNTSVTHANVVSLPGAINGKIQSAKDYDAFRFRAEKDQRIVFDVIAQKFNSPLDALLTLTDANGNVIQRNDDSTSADARIDQTFGASGDYFLFIEDLLERGGSDFAYRIECTSPKANFNLKFVNDTPRVPRGGRVPVRVEVARSNGHNEPIRVVAKNLPTGLHAEPLIINGGDAGLIFISASADAPLGSSPVEFEAIANNVRKAVKPFAGDRAVKEGFITVLESAPFLVHAAQLFATAEQDQTVNLEALVERQNGFAGEIKLSLEGFSAGRDPVTKSFDYQPITLKGNESKGAVAVKAKLDSEIGARMMVFKGESGDAVQYSAPFPVATSQLPFVLTTTSKRVILTALPSGSQSSAGEAFFLVKADRRQGFEGEITLQVEGSLDGVTITADKMAAGAKEANVKLVASDKAVVGKETQLTITGVGTFKDKTYRFKPAAIALLVNAPEATEVKTAEVAPVAPTVGAAK